MNRRDLLRRASTGMVTLATVGLAGCSGDSSDDGGDDDGDGNGSTTPTPTQEEMGSVREDTVDGVEIVGWEHEIDEEQSTRESLVVDVTIKNVGEETTDVIKYPVSVYAYDENGEEMQPLGGSADSKNDGEIDPGESAGKIVRPIYARGSDPANMSAYELVIQCNGYNSGVYCEE